MFPFLTLCLDYQNKFQYYSQNTHKQRPKPAPCTFCSVTGKIKWFCPVRHYHSVNLKQKAFECCQTCGAVRCFMQTFSEICEDYINVPQQCAKPHFNPLALNVACNMQGDAQNAESHINVSALMQPPFKICLLHTTISI